MTINIIIVQNMYHAESSQRLYMTEDVLACNFSKLW